MKSKNGDFVIKTDRDIEIMTEGGKKLAGVKKELMKMVKVGVSAKDVEDKANELIETEGAKPSFKMVPNYYWATCVNVNQGIVHGIPKADIVFKKGDVVSVDVGLFYKGFHTDTSFTVAIEPDKDTKKFLDTGKKALKLAISKAKKGKRIYDISKTIEDTISKQGYSPVKALVGHGVGRELHEEPQIPCFTNGEKKNSPVIPEGAVIAIEVMYSFGSGDVGLEEDGWTISTSDDTISALYEDTVAVYKNSNSVLTD